MDNIHVITQTLFLVLLLPACRKQDHILNSQSDKTKWMT